MEVVAEGVETETELEQLKAAHCDEAQGFLLGRPAPLEVRHDRPTASSPGGPVVSRTQ
jgi:EAL domain-containing protein (putative c-di-GMP-specific phosphodiesterase class I)